MKKFAKMSLVAAFAVAGLTSTASAGSLEEAIKGVNISGTVSYRAEKTVQKNDGDDSEAQHDIDVSLTAVVPVNDNITATLVIDENNDDDSDKTLDSDGNQTTAKDSSHLQMDIDKVYFTYNNSGLTAKFGLMSAPYTDGDGDGVEVAKTLGDHTLSAGYFYNTNMDTDEVYYIGAAGTVGMVSYDAKYAVKDDSSASNNDGTATDTGSKSFHGSVSGTVENIALAAYYGMKDDALSTAKKQTQYKLTASTTVGGVTLGAEFAQNGKDGGDTVFAGNDIAASEISIGALELHGEGDASAILVSAAVAVGEKGTAKVRYAKSNAKTANTDIKVLRVNYDYAMSSNFALGLEYTRNDDDAATDKASDYVVSAKYSF
ncbi:porin [Arcobacter sp. HD9-500m-PIT-SAG03]|nr:porin [Arcobacter sp. HD9-500m-PIT-SAG03]